MIIEISFLLAVFISIGVSLWQVKRARKHQTKETGRRVASMTGGAMDKR